MGLRCKECACRVDEPLTLFPGRGTRHGRTGQRETGLSNAASGMVSPRGNTGQPNPLTAPRRASMVPPMTTAHNVFFGICREIIRS